MLYYLGFCLLIAMYEIVSLWNHPYPQSFAFKAKRFATAFAFAPVFLICYIGGALYSRWG